MLLYVRSTKGIKRLTKEERSFYTISDNTGKALVGIMLSDGHISRRTKTSNPRLHFCQSGKIQKRSYFNLVYDLFKIYCNKDYNYYIRT
jgi:LAGLIDADG DNA endonuclease family